MPERRKFVYAAAVGLAVGLAAPASAQNIGIAISNFNDNFLTLLREAMSENAEKAGAKLQFEDAQMDVSRQLSQVENFIAAGVDGLVVAPVDGDSTTSMTAAAEKAGIPLVYINSLPVNLKELPDDEAFVGSQEAEAGKLEGQDVCRILTEQGKDKTGATAVIMLGELSNQATRLRTQAVKDVLATPECSFIKVTDEQTAVWQRTQATDLMANWLSAGIKPDAVIANNDEMAIGAIQALASAGVAMDTIVIGGVDATPDALQAIGAGDLDVTVLQSAPGQGKGAIDTILALVAKKEVPQEIYVPFELVNSSNYKEYLSK